MTEQQESISGEMLAGWKTRIDELATALMIQGDSAAAVDELRALALQMKQHGAGISLGVVEVLIQKLAANAEEGAGYLLKSGLAELHASLDARPSEEGTTQGSQSLGEDAELVADFLVEAREHLGQIESQMLALEKDPTAMEVIHAVFRAFHTIKGLAGFLDFAKVQALAHEVETLLDLARNAKLVIDSSIVDVVLESGDALRGDLLAIEHALNAGTPLEFTDKRVLLMKIRSLAVPRDAAPVQAESVAPAAPVTPVAPSAVSAAAIAAPQPVTAPAPEPEAAPEPKAAPAAKAAQAAPARKPAAARKPASAAKAAPAAQPAPPPPPPPAAQAPSAPQSVTVTAAEPTEDELLQQIAALSIGPKPVALPTPPAAAIPAAATVIAHPEAVNAPPVSAPAPQAARPTGPETAPTKEPVPAKEASRSPDASSVRVETSKLDHLMDMVGEIVIAQSLIRHNPVLAAATDSRLLGDLSQLARVTIEVQRATMSMRMVPVGQLFQRIERVIRDLSRKAGKHVVLETSGSETEIDKTVAEELSDPLLHMVRNSVDHGIEPAEERIAAGKTTDARIRLSAYHQGGQVIIQISDDGRGLNSEKIRKKAEEKHLISSATQLTETEVYQLIFEPGFSTADKITDVSGRGVGMDVVRRNVEKLRGRIETQSTLGKGTTFLLKLPLTLAIIDGLVVEVGTQRYIIPLSGVREIFRPQADALFTVEGRDEMLLVRGKLMPVVRLHERLGIDARASKPSDGLIVVLESEGRRFCLLVDDLLGKQEVVIKSLGETFKNVSGLSGCAVLGDGRVGLILDIDGIYKGRRS